jgi:sodium/potassium/calcium exchanger 6
VDYLNIFYCKLADQPALAGACFIGWCLLLFACLVVVAERFWTPSVELIAEALQLSPCVAGATLLSFGNGAPDILSQIAAYGSDSEGPGIEMSLSEPIGTGLFVCCLVLGLVVLFQPSHTVTVDRRHFLKDVCFYLVSVVMVLVFLIRGVIGLAECSLLAALYVVYVLLTIHMSRGQEPVHVDPRKHEVPHEPWEGYPSEDTGKNTCVTST